MRPDLGTARGAIVACALSWSIASHAQQIDVEDIDGGRYRATLTHDAVLDERRALALVRHALAPLCGDRTVEIGRYRFEASEPVDGATSGRSPTFFMEAQVGCADAPGAASPERPSLPAGSEELVRERVRALSVEYLSAVMAGELDAARERQSATLRTITDRAPWREATRRFAALAGPLVGLDVTRLTVYDNPPGAPMPGVYVAADYTAGFENVPLRCGFVVWYLDTATWRAATNGPWRVVREESGHLDAAQVASLSPAALADARRSFGCIEE